MRPRCRYCVLLAGAFLSLVPAFADVDTEVPLPAKVQGSLATDEVETVRFFAPEGAALQLKLKAGKKSGLDPDVRILDPDGADFVIPASNLKDKGSSIKVKKLVLERSGVWAVEVSGDGAGDYGLTVKAKPPKKLTQDVDLGGDPVDMVLPLQRGSIVKVTVKATKGSAVSPVLQEFDGEDVSAEGKRTGTLHKATLTAGASGDLVLRLGGEGTPGAASVSVKIKPAKSKTAKVDVRGASLGRPAGGETAVGKVIAPADGGEVAASASSDLFGASVSVPAGALTEPTLISIRSAEPEVIADPDEDAAAGPTVEFGPSGLEFSQPVDVTVPLDPSQVAVQTTENDITVLVVEADGSSQEIVPTDVDLEAGTCTVPASGFSRFTAIAPPGSPQLAGRSYWGFAFDANLEEEFSPRNESGIRRVSVADVLLDFDPDGVSWSGRYDERQVFFGLRRGQNDVLEPVLDVSTETLFDSGTWRYGSGGRRAILTFDQEEFDDRLFVSRDGSVLLNTTQEPDEGTPFDALLDVFVERPDVADPSALLTGTYLLGELDVSPELQQGGDYFDLAFLSSIGTVRFDPAGVLSFDLQHVEALGFVQQSPPAFEIVEDRDRGQASWVVEPSGPFAGTIKVDAGEDDGFRVYPHRDGRMFVMTSQEQDGEVSLLVGVRRSEKRSNADLQGNHAFGTCFFEFRDYQIEDGFPGSGQFLSVPDFSLDSLSGRALFDGEGGVTIVHRSPLYQERDPQEPGGVFRDRELRADETLGYTVAKNGELRFVVEGQEPRGAVTADGSFGFLVQDPDAQSIGLLFFVNRPPEQER